MQIEYFYCKYCADTTAHTISKGVAPHMTGTFSRIFWGIGTLGFSELATDTFAKCSYCKKVSVID